MDASRRLLLIFVVISTSEFSVSDTVEPTCEDYDLESYNLLEGEAFYFVPYIFHSKQYPDEEFTWYKNNAMIEYRSSDEKDRIHYHGGALFFLNLLIEDSGLYIVRHVNATGECSKCSLQVDVFKTNHKNNSELLYGKIANSDENKMVPCPQPVKKTCHDFNGSFTWYKNFTLLQGEHEDHVWVKRATKAHEAIYTCMCTWTHNNKSYNSSASRWLEMKEKVVHRNNVEILSPTNKEQFADEGVGIKLNCSVFCGINIKDDCHASWYVNGKPFNRTDGYNQTTTIITENPSNTISTAILTIDKVSAEDFQTEFNCNGRNFYSCKSVTLRLKRRASIIPLVFGALCVLFFFVFAVMLVKHFIIDLTLFFRPYFPVRSYDKDVRTYDAYVVYQTQSMDKVTEDTIYQFVTKMLPSVLEEKCGYRLFIHGRDDLPGEDHLEMVEDRMEQSRRLIVILTPGSGTHSKITEESPAPPQNSTIGGYDWQVGLHHVLVQREMKVILIHLGETGPQGYTHLPPSLQHLIRRRAPIKWPVGSRSAAAWDSCFWKRVRYLMPAIPVKKCSQSAII